MKKSLILTVCAIAAIPLFAERYEYDRYKSIVDRQMFGPLPAGFDPSKPPSEAKGGTNGKTEKELTKEQEQIKKSVSFSAINVTPSGETAVGFTDNSNSKEVRHYYLKVGEKRDGWEVKEADPVKATMTIVKDGISLDLELGSSSNGGGAPAPAAGGSNAARPGGLFGRQRNLGGGNAGGANAAGGNNMFGSLRARQAERRRQLADAAAEQKAKEAADAEAKAKADEERAQRDAEREQQRQQLMQIQEELKKQREERQAREAEERASVEKDSASTADE